MKQSAASRLPSAAFTRGANGCENSRHATLRRCRAAPLNFGTQVSMLAAGSSAKHGEAAGRPGGSHFGSRRMQAVVPGLRPALRSHPRLWILSSARILGHQRRWLFLADPQPRQHSVHPRRPRAREQDAEDAEGRLASSLGALSLAVHRRGGEHVRSLREVGAKSAVCRSETAPAPCVVPRRVCVGVGSFWECAVVVQL